MVEEADGVEKSPVRLMRTYKSPLQGRRSRTGEVQRAAGRQRCEGEVEGGRCGGLGWTVVRRRRSGSRGAQAERAWLEVRVASQWKSRWRPEKQIADAST